MQGLNDNNESRKRNELHVNPTHQGLSTQLIRNTNNLESRENDRGLLLHLVEDWPVWNTDNFQTAGTTFIIVGL